MPTEITGLLGSPSAGGSLLPLQFATLFREPFGLPPVADSVRRYRGVFLSCSKCCPACAIPVRIYSEDGLERPIQFHAATGNRDSYADSVDLPMEYLIAGRQASWPAPRWLARDRSPSMT